MFQIRFVRVTCRLREEKEIYVSFVKRACVFVRKWRKYSVNTLSKQLALHKQLL